MERRTRLRKTSDFERLKSSGSSWPHRLLVLVSLPNGLDYTRVGVTASRRVGGAVARNRAKRLLRESTRHLYPHIRPGLDLLLIARPAVLKEKEPRVREALGRLLEQAELFQTGN
jgi:ribonuclease P protein component